MKWLWKSLQEGGKQHTDSTHMLARVRSLWHPLLPYLTESELDALSIWSRVRQQSHSS